MTSLADHMRTLASYNAWANARLYAAAATLPDALYRQEAGAYFGSLHGTLNHLLVTDRLCLRRLTGEGDAPNRLDVILFEHLDDLRRARVAEDARLEAYVAGLSPEALAATFDYATTSGVPQCQPRAEALAHLFNHQTHHRGQAHAILTRLGVAEPPSLDLLILQRERGRRDITSAAS
ncbi:DinB family protein [Methylobacterium sp. A54F]